MLNIYKLIFLLKLIQCLEITMINNGDENMYFLGCNTINNITNDINVVLKYNKYQLFDIKSLDLYNGNCDYKYYSYIINFQWFLDNNNFYYGITNYDHIETYVYIIDKYNVLFMVK